MKSCKKAHLRIIFPKQCIYKLFSPNKFLHDRACMSKLPRIYTFISFFTGCPQKYLSITHTSAILKYRYLLAQKSYQFSTKIKCRFKEKNKNKLYYIILYRLRSINTYNKRKKSFDTIYLFFFFNS